MSAVPSPAIRSLTRPTAATVLESLRAQRDGPIALATGAESASTRAPALQDDNGLAPLLLRGAVVELEALPGAGALTLGFRLLAEVRRRALLEGRPAWLAAVDPSRTLHAPAVAAILGRDLAQLVVMQPPIDRLLRTAVRAQRCGAFAGILIDASSESDVSGLVNGVRRLTFAVEETQALAVLVTSSRARRGLALPVAARALVESVGGEVHARFLKHRLGRTAPLAIAR